MCLGIFEVEPLMLTPLTPSPSPARGEGSESEWVSKLSLQKPLLPSDVKVNPKVLPGVSRHAPVVAASRRAVPPTGFDSLGTPLLDDRMPDVLMSKRKRQCGGLVGDQDRGIEQAKRSGEGM